MPDTPKVTLYTRKGCCLCDEARFDLDEVDIERQPDLEKLYSAEVPVIAINGNKAFKYRVSVDEFLKKLAARG